MLARTSIKRKSKTKPAIYKRFHGWVAQLSCIACDSWPVEVHHVRHDGLKGISKDHRIVVPLCADCHRLAPYAVHRTSHPDFNALWGINMFARANRLWEQFNG